MLSAPNTVVRTLFATGSSGQSEWFLRFGKRALELCWRDVPEGRVQALVVVDDADEAFDRPLRVGEVVVVTPGRPRLV